MRGFFNVKTLAALSAVMFFSACSESKNDTAAAASKPATEEKVVNFMDEMLTEEGNTTVHYDEYNEVFEGTVHDNACFDFMF